MGSLKLGTRARRWLSGTAYASAFSLLLSAFGIQLAHGQSVDQSVEYNLKFVGGIAGLLAGCDGDKSGWEKIEQFLAKIDSSPYKSNSSMFRSYLTVGYAKAVIKNVVEVDGQEKKLPCDELKSTGALVQMKQFLIANMTDLINAAP